jgi:hypothetical protein
MSLLFCLFLDFIFRIAFFSVGRCPVGVRAAMLRIDELLTGLTTLVAKPPIYESLPCVCVTTQYPLVIAG